MRTGQRCQPTNRRPRKSPSARACEPILANSRQSVGARAKIAAQSIGLATTFSDYAVEHHHIDFVAGCHMTLVVPEHNQAVGLNHGTEHA